MVAVNNSHIRAWWIGHHYIAVALCFICLVFFLIQVWPDTKFYSTCITWLFQFGIYLCLVRYFQYNYQLKRLRTLVALDKASPMDTVGGQGGVFRVESGFYLLVPFLLLAQLWQLSIAYKMLIMYFTNHCESHVFIAAVLVGIMGALNAIHTFLTFFGHLSVSLW